MMRRERSRRPVRRARHDEQLYSLDDVARVMERRLEGYKAGNPRNLNDLVSDFMSVLNRLSPPWRR